MENLEEILKNREIIFIDVREKEELANGTIEKSLHIPLTELQNHLEELKNLEDKKKTIIFYCRSGARSQKVVDFLKNKAFNHVYNGGGFNELLILLSKIHEGKQNKHQ